MKGASHAKQLALEPSEVGQVYKLTAGSPTGLETQSTLGTGRLWFSSFMSFFVGDPR